MKKNKTKTAGLKKLHDRAKAILKTNPSSTKNIATGDLHELVENLKIYQIELEIQNDELRGTQARLEESQLKYFELYDVAPVGYVTMNSKGVILEINLTAADLLGFPRSQLISKNFSRFIFPDFQDVFYGHCNTVLKTREKKNCELKLIKKDGGQFFVQVNTLPIQMDNGDVNELRSTMTDITERKLLECALLESKNTMQALNDANSESAMLLDRKGTLLMINETAARRMGQDAEAMIGLNINDVLPPEVSKERKNRFDEVLNLRRPLSFQDSCMGRRYLHSLQPILNSKGEVEKVAVYVRDITLDHEALEALIESEKEYRLLVNTAPIGVVVTQDMLLKLANPHALSVSGYSEQELTSGSFIEIVHPDDRAMLASSHVRRLNGEEVPETYLMRIITKNGEIKCIENKGVLITWMGRPATLNFLFDVTERQLAADALFKSEAQKRTILNAATDLIHYVDNEMKLIWANKAVLQEFNVSMEKITGRFCYHTFYHRNAICNDCPSVKARQTRQIESTVLHMGEKPNARYWDVSSAPLMDEQEKISGFIQIARDITAQRKSEQALRESEARFRNIIENAPFGYYRVGKDGLWQYVNPEWEKMYGYSYHEIIDKHFELIQPLESKAQAREMILKGLSGETLNGEFRRQLKNGTIGYHDYSIQPVFKNDKVVAVEGFIIDITQHKESEEKIHELSQLLIEAQEKERHLISCELHDSIAQNLSVLKIHCDLIYNDPSMMSPALREKLTAFCRLLTQTITDVRNLAYDLRLPGLEEMGLVKALENYCEEASENGKVIIDFQSAGMSVMDLDGNMEIHIYRLIQEGLNNIRKHAEADHATIILLGSSPNIILRIEDNGRGFDVKAQELLSASTKRMGIRSMQERVNLLYGQMTIQSQPMKGTKIFIKIPL
ncbi:MAG: PAS domain S-box protein [Deltaproteobacteria bacterium]|nr:PAS domain S-box protein [Deltaproteobacteria bacterium]